MGAQTIFRIFADTVLIGYLVLVSLRGFRPRFFARAGWLLGHEG